MKLEFFLQELGSIKGAPGGGAAAALTGATGAALAEMVARLNDKRAGASSGTAAKAAALRKKLHRLIAEDAEAFEQIQKAYALRKKKPAVWQRALKNGAKPPLEICGACVVAAQLAAKEKPRTSRWLESDRREALLLLRAAFDAAKLNVDINLKEISGRAIRNQIQGKMKRWRRQFQKY